jgi:uncharacterized protein YegJ (DUF2314 family)
MACASPPADHAAVPPKPLRADPIRFEFAVYYLPVPTSDPEVRLDALLAGGFPGFRRVQKLSAGRGQSVMARRVRDVKGAYPPPPAEALHDFSHGLTAEQEAALLSSREALILDFRISGEPPWKGLRAACELVERIARATGGLVWDEETREFFTPEAWEHRRLAAWTAEIPEVSRHVTIHVYSKDGGLRAVSLGMAKLGLPDVAVEGFSGSSLRPMGNLVNLVEQALAEGVGIGDDGAFTLRLRDIRNAHVREDQLASLKRGAKGEARLRLRAGVKEEGDPDNRLLVIGFDRSPGPDPTARQHSLIASLFGSEDSTTEADMHDEELLAASRAARAELPALHQAFEAGLASGEYILVKAPFEVPGGGQEWMWVEVRSWMSGTITGLLKNDPSSVPNLKAGQIVTVKEVDLFDYIHHRADGKEEGNRTGAILDQDGLGRI